MKVRNPPSPRAVLPGDTPDPFRPRAGQEHRLYPEVPRRVALGETSNRGVIT